MAMTTANFDKSGVSTMATAMSSTSATTTSSGMSDVSDTSSLGPKGCSPQMMFKPGYNSSSLPREVCSNTTSDWFRFDVDASEGWKAIHLVNAGAVSRLTVSLDGHSMFVYAADGLYVELQEVKVGFMWRMRGPKTNKSRFCIFRSVNDTR